MATYRHGADGLDERGVGSSDSHIVTNVYELLKQFGRKQSLEPPSVPFRAVEVALEGEGGGGGSWEGKGILRGRIKGKMFDMLP